MKRFLLLALCLCLTGCANPLNQATSDRYGDECAQDEDAGDLARAEQACYRALVNVDTGNLGPQQKSMRLYDLGRVKRQLGKFAEAEDLFKQSLDIEKTLSGPTSVKVGRRLVELSVSLAAQDKWDEGAQYLQQAIPIAPQFVGGDRDYAKLSFGQYAQHFQSTDAALAGTFQAAADTLGK